MKRTGSTHPTSDHTLHDLCTAVDLPRRCGQLGFQKSGRASATIRPIIEAVDVEAPSIDRDLNALRRRRPRDGGIKTWRVLLMNADDRMAFVSRAGLWWIGLRS